MRTELPDLAQALELALARLERSLPGLRRARERGLLPHVTERGRWELLSPLSEEFSALTGLPWTGGFVAGQLWLASRFPQHEGLASEARAVTDLLAPRAGRPDTHDLGFLFWPSAILGYRATGDPALREIALRAAGSLTRRVLPAGLIQVIGPLDDPAYRGRVIVDTLPNLVLLWWAEREGDETAGAVARSHVAASIDAFVRPDGSTTHAVRVADDGAIVERSTINGYAADSTWARGQAWAVLGLANAFGATGDKTIGEAARKTARLFLERLPPDGIPNWDFDAPPGPRDASASAIVASALLDLADGDPEHANQWRESAVRLLRALAGSCLNRGAADGLLLHCCYRQPFSRALDEATVWGDFFLLDALIHAVDAERHVDPAL